MMWGYGFGWGWLLMSFGMVLWIALLVVLTWAIIRWLDRKAGVSAPTASALPESGASALEILRQRYARGEIDTASFEHMRAQLEVSGRHDYQDVRQ